jgi:hypothetical protein
MRRLCATVLVMEALVIALAIPVAISVGHADPGLAGGIGGAVAVTAIVVAGLLGRHGTRWPYAVASVLQGLVIAGGVVVPVLFFLGAIFAALWVTAIWLGYRVEHSPTH